MIEKYQRYLERTQSIAEQYVWGEDQWMKNRLHNLISDLKEKIRVLEMIEKQEDNIIIPNFFYECDYEKYEFDDVIYVIAKNTSAFATLENYNTDSYAYIKNGDGLISLNVHALKSDDMYGERFFTNSSYYRTRDLSNWHNGAYYSKSYGKGHRYPNKFKEHVEFIRNKLKEHGFEINEK